MQDEVRVPAFEPRRFRSAAAHYREGRPAYPARLFARVATLTGLGRGGRVLDLGCGPGQLAIGFAPYAAECVGLDPEPEMLRVARDAATETGVAISFAEGSSRDLGPQLGRFRLVAIGRAFHWMDRAQTLRRLDGLVEHGGAVALFNDRHPDVPENAWRRAWRELLDRYAEDSPRVGHRAPGWVRHEAVLLDSAFACLERIGVVERRRTAVASLVERALSLSSTSRARIGTAADALARELPGVLAPFAPDGAVTEVVELEALLAFRPGERIA